MVSTPTIAGAGVLGVLGQSRHQLFEKYLDVALFDKVEEPAIVT